MSAFSARPGFALPAVLFIAVLGIMLGIGRLMVFRNQCNLRIDRQQEYEKVFAVRSALNRLQNWSEMPDFPEEGGDDGIISLHTDSGRNISVSVHPADAIFPILNNINHFCINRTTAVKSNFTRIDGTRYRYVSSAQGDSSLKRGASGQYVCLMPKDAVPGDRCRISLDMSDTGRWSDDPFGRRYAFNVRHLCVNSGGTNDLVRFILRRKRNGEIFNGPAGVIGKSNEDWRPARANESAIYAELRTGGTDAGSFTAWTQKGLQPAVECVSQTVTNTFSASTKKQNSFGIQLVGRRLTLFQAISPTGIFRQYNFTGTAQIPEDVYYDFTNNVISSVSADPVLLPNLVMELEVEASPSRDAAGVTPLSGNDDNAQNQFSHFEVYPAFEFAIAVENKNERYRSEVPAESKLATVVHLDIDQGRSSKCTAITYDTHGTEIRGWRTGERMSWGVIR